MKIMKKRLVILLVMFFLGLTQINAQSTTIIRATSLRDLVKITDYTWNPTETAIGALWDIDPNLLVNDKKLMEMTCWEFVQYCHSEGYNVPIPTRKELKEDFDPWGYLLDFELYFDNLGFLIPKKTIDKALKGTRKGYSELMNN